MTKGAHKYLIGNWAETSLSQPGTGARHMGGHTLFGEFWLGASSYMCPSWHLWSVSVLLMWHLTDACVYAWDSKHQSILISWRPLISLTRRCNNKYLLNEWLLIILALEVAPVMYCQKAKHLWKATIFSTFVVKIIEPNPNGLYVYLYHVQHCVGFTGRLKSKDSTSLLLVPFSRNHRLSFNPSTQEVE